MPPTRVPDTIVDFLRETAVREGSRDALLIRPAFRYVRWTYDQLWEDSGRVATLIQRRGLAEGDQAIRWGPNSPHWVLAFFGCLRAGVVLIALDLRSAPDYVARVTSRTDPKLALATRQRKTWNSVSRKFPLKNSKPPFPAFQILALSPSVRTIWPRSCSPSAPPGTLRG